VRSAQRRGKVFARAPAWIEKTAAQQLPPRVPIHIVPPALYVRREWSAEIRPFLPANPEPMQILKRGFGVIGPAAIWVQVIHPHYQRPARLAPSLPRRPEGTGVPYVQIAGGRRRKPAAICGDRTGRGAGHAALQCSQPESGPRCGRFGVWCNRSQKQRSSVGTSKPEVARPGVQPRRFVPR